MAKNKTYIILLIIIFTFFVVMFLMFGVKNVNQGKYKSTIIVGNNTVWSYENKKWSNIESISKVKELDWNTYKVYVDNKLFGDYQLWHDDKWYVFDSNKNAVSISGNLLAYNSNYDIDVSEFSEFTIEDRTYINYVLQENNISPSSETTSEFMIKFDFDKDGVEENFYVISNAFPLDFDPDIIFSIVFMVKDEKVYYIYNDISNNTYTNGCLPFFTSFLDADGDDNNEFILSCGKYSISEQVDMLYKFENNDFKILISNQ